MESRIIVADCREALKGLGAGSVHCVVTSPPYFGLRDYGCHGQIGLEKRAPLYVEALADVFSEVWRVLRDDGCVFVNIGDTYAGYKDGKFPPQRKSNGNQRSMPLSDAPHRSKSLLSLDGFRDKELMGIPWRFAFAMRDRGWLLRQDIIWAKTTYTPEKVRDRFVRSHEHVFLFTKSSRYYFDGDAVRIPADSGKTKLRPDVWDIGTSSFRGAHFATYPLELAEVCVLSGSPVGGIVLDPFIGSGTTAIAAERHGRGWVGCELNPEYADIATIRIQNERKLL